MISRIPLSPKSRRRRTHFDKLSSRNMARNSCRKLWEQQQRAKKCSNMYKLSWFTGLVGGTDCLVSLACVCSHVCNSNAAHPWGVAVAFEKAEARKWPIRASRGNPVCRKYLRRPGPEQTSLVGVSGSVLITVSCLRLGGNTLAEPAHIRVLRAPMDGMLVSFGSWTVRIVWPVSRRHGLEVSLVMAVPMHVYLEGTSTRLVSQFLLAMA